MEGFVCLFLIVNSTLLPSSCFRVEKSIMFLLLRTDKRTMYHLLLSTSDYSG